MPRKLFLVALLFLATSIAFSQTASQRPKTRHFTFDYSFTVNITDTGKPLDVCFPMAHSDQFQKVRIVSKTGDLPLQETTEPEYGNRMFHAHTAKADKAEYHFTV